MYSMPWRRVSRVTMPGNPIFRLRKEVKEVSGQSHVPVMVDGEVILSDEYEIIDYLKTTYSSKTQN